MRQWIWELKCVIYSDNREDENSSLTIDDKNKLYVYIASVSGGYGIECAWSASNEKRWTCWAKQKDERLH